MYGGGSIDDNYPLNTLSSAKALIYRGWETKIVTGPWPGGIEAALRYDSYTHEYDENGYENINDQLTAGVTLYRGPARFQFNYIFNLPRDNNAKAQDLADDLLVLNFQMNIPGRPSPKENK